MFTFLLIIHIVIAAALVGVILMQRSEGGGLGMGGSPSGLMSARGAADFLTRATTILATLFVLMSILLAALASVSRGPRTIDTSLARQTPAAPAAPAVPSSPVPIADPLAAAGAAGAPAVPVAPAASPAPAGAAPTPAPAKRSARPAPKPAAAEQSIPLITPPPPAPAAEKPPVLVVPPKPATAPTTNSSVPLAQ